MKCWFCSVRDPIESDSYEFDMYGKVDARGTDSDQDIAYNVRHIVIPRCADCRGKHGTAKAARVFAIVFLAALLGGLLSMLFEWVSPLIAGLWAGLAAGLLIAMLLAAALVQKGIKSLKSGKKSFPKVEELVKECYRFGVRPKLPVKSDPPCSSDEKEKGETIEGGS
jgi:hypothetical protein